MTFDYTKFQQQLRHCLASLALKQVSFILTGSLAKGEARIEHGNLCSDIDVLVVVNDRTDVHALKQDLAALKQANQQLSLVLTRREKIVERPCRGFLLDLTSEQVLYDDLGVEDLLCRPKAYSEAEKRQAAMQEWCYYYAKYRYQGEAHLYSKLLTKQLKLFGKRDELIVPWVSQDHVDQAPTQWLASSSFFLQNSRLNAKVCFEVVRDLVFLENQGMTFKESVVGY